MDGAIALALALTCRKRRTSKKERTKWAKQWFLNRAKFGHSKLLKELGDNEPDDYKKFFCEWVEIAFMNCWKWWNLTSKKKTQYSQYLRRRVSYALSFFCQSLYSLL
ncbi:hypothetical protein ElyMa_006204100 [Elysia marginata]|uniref:Uncharacterized protein n=1 Tax=Elysia marginata TaxID=1093978 RepID=A0AAV4H4S2_9GAST|nr:hypothetical protein ElyMa_006204100 [Elysia marginata]